MNTRIQKIEFGFLGIALLGIWMLTHPYRGIYGDGMLYAVQSLHWLHPENFSHDPFFVSGSQDGYTLFSPLYGGMIKAFGLDHASLFLMLFSASVWLYGLWRLGQTLELKGEPLLVSLLIVLLSPGAYGSDSVFAIGESTVTPRILAEAFCMLAIAFSMEKRWGLAWSIIGIAAALHPLMALPVVALAMIMVTGNYIRAAIIAVGLAAIVLALSFQSGGPFHLLRETMSPDWLSLARERSPFVFPDLWHFKDYSQLCLDATIVWLGYRFLLNGQRVLALALFVVLSGFVVTAYLGASVFQNALIVGLQLWRAQWIVHLIAMLMLFPLCVRLWWRFGYWERALAIGVVCSWMAADAVAGPMALLVASIYSLIRRFVPHYLPPRLIHWALLAIPVQILIWKLAVLYPLLVIDVGYSFRPIWIEALTYPVVGLGVYFSIRKLMIALEIKANCYTVKALWLIPAILGFYFWDIRAPEQIFDNPERQAAIAPVKAAIPSRSLVYWEDGVDQSWLLLNRANFSSAAQTAGSVFSRENALLLAYRTSLLGKMGFKDNTQLWKDKDRASEEKVKTMKIGALETLCVDPNLDFVITRKSTDSLPMFTFSDPGKGRRYHLYSCRQLFALKNGRSKADSRS